MSTKQVSRSVASTVPYKKLLEQAAQLRGQGGVGAFKRTKLLVEVFDDRDFRLDNGNIDDFKCAAILDTYVEDLALQFFDLRAMLEVFPKRSDWEQGKLRTMHQTVQDRRPRPERAVKPRKCATVAEVAALKDENKRLKAQLAAAQKRIKELQEENTRLRRHEDAALAA
jgi:hypothetical protein